MHPIDSESLSNDLKTRTVALSAVLTARDAKETNVRSSSRTNTSQTFQRYAETEDATSSRTALVQLEGIHIALDQNSRSVAAGAAQCCSAGRRERISINGAYYTGIWRRRQHNRRLCCKHATCFDCGQPRNLVDAYRGLHPSNATVHHCSAATIGSISATVTIATTAPVPPTNLPVAVCKRTIDVTVATSRSGPLTVAMNHWTDRCNCWFTGMRRVCTIANIRGHCCSRLPLVRFHNVGVRYHSRPKPVPSPAEAELSVQ